MTAKAGGGAEWQPQIAASILTADFGHLDRVVRKLERAGVDRLHLDVMDGHFVPNLTFGPDICAAFRRLTHLPIDIHLMIDQPSVWIDRFLDTEPDTVTFHVEAPEPEEEKRWTLARIRERGADAGLAVSPETEVEQVFPFGDALDLVMVMTVRPGFGGQRFIAAAAPKLAVAAKWFADRGRPIAVHVDGGVNRDTAMVAGAWGADVCVVGSALFQRGQDAADEVRLVRARAAEGRERGVEGVAPLRSTPVAIG
ncbi:MAG: ribulose-phosphate 3-epimerase [Chloroflexota bacterium]|jgi:ribulose-phosphate 3-epimerase|nr:ribulose-phosphate 3-epimerase [Chloroflexota bacterium]